MFKKLVYSALFAKCVEADRHLQSNSTMPLDPAVDCGINQTLTADGLECVMCLPFTNAKNGNSVCAPDAC